MSAFLSLGFKPTPRSHHPAPAPVRLPFFIVPLTHERWEEATVCAENLPEEALPELRLDCFPEEDPARLVQDLKRRCLVTCRRAEEGGRWVGTESERLERLQTALEARPAWVDLEWDLDASTVLGSRGTHIRLIRSVHVAPGCFDVEDRLNHLPDGDAFKWVGHAATLADNARLRPALSWAAQRGISLSAFLMGPKGIPSRCLQRAWGGAFTYAAPDDGPIAAPGQIPLSVMQRFRCHKLTPSFALCGVLGSPVQHSKSPAFHNERFQRAFKDLLYLPLECPTAEEALAALETLGLLGVSLTAPLKESLPAALGLEGPLNTLWRRNPGAPWHTANTDREALAAAVQPLPEGPVLLLGDGGVATTSRLVLESLGRPLLQVSRRNRLTPEVVGHHAPVGVIQATSLGMHPEDPLPFPEALEAARPSLRWAVEWIYKETTAFADWATHASLHLVGGDGLFHAQAEAQSRRFVEGCG